MADSEAGWERFRADIRGSRVVDTKKTKPTLQFHIPIHPQAPKYRPGSGPPPPRPNLRPVHDSNAFIVDKVVLPRGHFHPDSGTPQRRCYYIIGWPDLPAARPVVDASKVLEYVSPRTLEDWEYQDALRREEERERAREAEEAEARALAKGKAVATAVGAGLQPGVKRRLGRPPKARMMMIEPPPEPELNSEQEELIHKRMRGPSLSTPQKSRIAQLEAEVELLEELEVVDEYAVPAMQGAPGIRGGESEDPSDGDVNKGVVDDLDDLRLSSVATGISSLESSRASSARTAPANQASAPDTSVASEARSRFPSSTTPIPLPSAFSRMKNWIPKAKSTSGTPTTVSRPNVAGVPGSAPIYPQSDPIQGQHSSSRADFPSHTNGFTPIGGTFPRPPKRSADGSPHSNNSPVSTKPRKRRKKKHADLPHMDPQVAAGIEGSPNPALDLAQGEQDYVVKRLEGDSILEGVHWFKVRWEGEWPEDQNPTWEPRENIAEKLVKQYLRRKAKREEDQLAKASAKKKSNIKQTNLLADQAKAYGSVMEAFEGQMNMDSAGDVDHDQADAHYEDVHDGGEVPDEHLVIYEDKEQQAAIERRKAMQSEFAAQLAGMARSAPRSF
ncbi:chromodomain protein-2 [Diaporthe helianthi]|uniref:Chromodomain protein-2 n=1 Tax=Diaporthe helianthi TaxID=158607 RepID=A0A2P5I6D2_DIAHE|nr:chromodomain protein-2 [Diaporthe helianthi]